MYEIVTPSGLTVGPPPGRCWMNVESEYKAQVAEGRFWFGPDGKGIPRRKTYLAERDGKSAWTWWPNAEVGHTQEGTREVRALFDKDGPTFFDFPKPVRLMQRIVQLATNADRYEIVLDFFAGSGTTAHAVMAQNALDGGNRSFVMVQLDEVPDAKSDAAKAGFASIAELSRDRIRRAAKVVAASGGLAAAGLDLGFRTLRLDTTNMADVLRTPDDTDQQTLDGLEDSVKPDRTGEDLLFQVLLVWGLDRDHADRCGEAGGTRGLRRRRGCACRMLRKRRSAPRSGTRDREARAVRAVFRDSSFASDDARINAEQVFTELSPATDVKAI